MITPINMIAVDIWLYLSLFPFNCLLMIILPFPITCNKTYQSSCPMAVLNKVIRSKTYSAQLSLILI